MLSIKDPTTGAVFQQIPIDTEEKIRAKFDRACHAQRSWAHTPIRVRFQAIQKFRGLLLDQQEALAQLLTREMGKPIAQARNEIQGTVHRIDFFLENTPEFLTEQTVFPVDSGANPKKSGLHEKITHEPLGVIGNISAWNYPYFIGSNIWIPALLTGNAVLYKPSEFASLTGLTVESLFHESGIPTDVFTTLPGPSEVGSHLLSLPLQGIFFTGSYATGKKILQALGPRQGLEIFRVQMELGGKDPVYVCEDVNIATTAAAVADGAFYNSGQSCCAVERIYVHQSIYDAFVHEFLNVVKSFVVGDPTDARTYIGPIAREAQLEIIQRQVKDALDKKAKLLCGGKRLNRDGFFFEPTVFSEVNQDMDLMKEESFGPIIGIQKVKDDDEAIQLMNNTAYGLTAAVFTNEKKRAEKVLSEMNTGTVYWNCCDRVSPRLPWIGRKHSGMGVTLSTYGIETFLQLKAWHMKG